MYCYSTGIIGHGLCWTHLQRNLYFGRMISQKVKNQMDTLCLYNRRTFSYHWKGQILQTRQEVRDSKCFGIHRMDSTNLIKQGFFLLVSALKEKKKKKKNLQYILVCSRIMWQQR